MSLNISVKPWREDAMSQVCDRCASRFTVFTRRHHCRRCGFIFCASCCHAFQRIPELGIRAPQRVCVDCESMLLYSRRVHLNGPDGERRRVLCALRSSEERDALPEMPLLMCEERSAARCSPPAALAICHQAASKDGVCDTPQLEKRSAKEEHPREQQRRCEAHESEVNQQLKKSIIPSPESRCVRHTSGVRKPAKNNLSSVSFHRRSGSSEASDMDHGLDTSSSDDDRLDGLREDPSSTLAEVLSNCRERTSVANVSFLSTLQNNIVNGEAENVLRVLLLPNDKCNSAIIVTVNKNETIADLTVRLSENYFRLANGPFTPFKDEQKQALLGSLAFWGELEQLRPNERAIDVARAYTHLVLSTMNMGQLSLYKEVIVDDPELRPFFLCPHTD